jgi:hypothetical protein
MRIHCSIRAYVTVLIIEINVAILGPASLFLQPKQKLSNRLGYVHVKVCACLCAHRRAYACACLKLYFVKYYEY